MEQATPETSSQATFLAPGSDEAIKAGCICPVIDNGHGKGYLGSGMFVLVEGCPVHPVHVLKPAPATEEAGR